jgi:lyso-ornithine lipid O-acyltransferase
MRETSRVPRRRAAARPLLARHAEFPALATAPAGAESRPGVLRLFRVLRRGAGVLLWTLPCMPIQALLLMLPGRAKVVFARSYWSMTTRLLGLRVQVIGSAAVSPAGRPVVFVSNHSSWLDVPVLGGRLDACFVSKDEVAGWPFISTIARLGRTVFVSRQ